MAKKKSNGKMWLDDNTLAAKRMQAIEVAARLPEDRTVGSMMSGSAYKEPGKSADKVIADAEKIMAFVMKSA